MAGIVVGYDGSETSASAVREAATLANALDEGLHLVCAVKRDGATRVYKKESWTIGGLDDAEEKVREMISRLDKRDRTTFETMYGDPADALVAEAKRLDARMIVVGNRRTQGVARVLGSVASDVVKNAGCSVHIAHTT